MQCAHEPFKSHASIDNVHRQLFQRAVSLAVELHEHEVPYLDNLRVVLVDKLAARHFGLLFGRARIEMYLRARPARPGVSHFPKIVVLVAVYYMVSRNVFCPILCCFVVASEAFFLRTFEHGYVQVARVKVQHIHEILPRIVYCAFLEIVAEAPVAEHFEHGVVVGIVSHLFKVVVLAAHAQALLRIGAAARFGVACAEYDVFPLVHAGVCEHKCGVVLYHHGGGRHYGVPFRGKELLE